MLNTITLSWSCEKFLTSTIFIQCHNDSLSVNNCLTGLIQELQIDHAFYYYKLVKYYNTDYWILLLFHNSMSTGHVYTYTFIYYYDNFNH